MDRLTWTEVQRDWTLPPNLVSLARLLLVIPISLTVVTSEWGWLGFWLFIIAALTDKLDGWLAKRNSGRWTSRLGKVLDSYVDKVLVLGTLLAVLSRFEPRLFVFVAITLGVIALREVVVVYVKFQQPIKSAAQAGRISMVVQCVAVALLIMPPTPVIDRQQDVALLLLGVAVSVSIWSGCLYVVEWRRLSR